MGRIGIPELLVILFILLLVFGAARLPGVARSIAQALREFKKTMHGEDDDKQQKKNSSAS